jgi:LysM repeat protein
MVSQRHLIKSLSLFLIVILALVACERPLQDTGEEVAPEVETAVAPEGGEEAEVPAQTVEATPAAGEEAGEVATEEEPAVSAGPTEEPEAAAETETAESEVVTAEEEEATNVSPRPTEETETAEETVEEATAEPETYVVQPGDNLYRIGLRHNVSWVVLAQHNNIANANAIYVGQKIEIPARPGTGNVTPTPPAAGTTYVVKPGDTLFRIGRAFNVNWVAIAEANAIVNPNRILVGQVLQIPGGTPDSSAQLTHTVQRGESLFTISLHYGVPWASIAEANNLSSPYVIYPGQTLVIPAAQ